MPVRTVLGPVNESLFQDWYKGHAKTGGLDPNPDNPLHFYDYRAAYLGGARPDKAGHWPSKFKLGGHPRTIVDGRNTRTGKRSQEATNSGILKSLVKGAKR